MLLCYIYAIDHKRLWNTYSTNCNSIKLDWFNTWIIISIDNPLSLNKLTP